MCMSAWTTNSCAACVMAAEAYWCRGLQVLVAFGAGHAIEDAAVRLKDAMPQQTVVLKCFLITSLLLHD